MGGHEGFTISWGDFKCGSCAFLEFSCGGDAGRGKACAQASLFPHPPPLRLCDVTAKADEFKNQLTSGVYAAVYMSKFPHLLV